MSLVQAMLGGCYVFVNHPLLVKKGVNRSILQTGDLITTPERACDNLQDRKSIGPSNQESGTHLIDSLECDRQEMRWICRNKFES